MKGKGEQRAFSEVSQGHREALASLKSDIKSSLSMCFTRQARRSVPCPGPWVLFLFLVQCLMVVVLLVLLSFFVVHPDPLSLAPTVEVLLHFSHFWSSLPRRPLWIEKTRDRTTSALFLILTLDLDPSCLWPSQRNETRSTRRKKAKGRKGRWSPWIAVVYFFLCFYFKSSHRPPLFSTFPSRLSFSISRRPPIVPCSPDFTI